MSTSGDPRLRACHCCGLVQRTPELEPGMRALCVRCRSTLADPATSRLSNSRALSAALAALVLYPFAISLPIMRLEELGHAREASIWTGSLELLRDGQVFVGLVVLLCSVVIPLLKLGGLVAIAGGPRALRRRHRARTYRLIEWAGRWGMLDVLLVALVVAWIKFGDLVEVSPGPGALTFTLCVVLSLVASAYFDPHALWDEEPECGAAPGAARER